MQMNQFFIIMLLLPVPLCAALHIQIPHEPIQYEPRLRRNALTPRQENLIRFCMDYTRAQQNGDFQPLQVSQQGRLLYKHWTNLYNVVRDNNPILRDPAIDLVERTVGAMYNPACSAVVKYNQALRNLEDSTKLLL